MTLLGKLLILFNLLAAGGFLYLATQDWKGRQTITAAALRHKLLLVGLPFEGPDTFNADDETPFRIEMAGSAHTETIGKKILELYFQAAPGGDPATTLGGDPGKAVVPCQLAEVKRVKAKVETFLKDKTDAEKVPLLKGWLIDQSENYDRRLEVQSLVAAGNATELEKRLLALFDAVLSSPVAASVGGSIKIADQFFADLRNSNVPDAVLLKLNPLKNKEMSQEDLVKELTNLLSPDEMNQFQNLIVTNAKIAQVADARSKPLDIGERQIRTAHLLVHLSPDAAWQKRVMIVVGLRRYVGAIAAQAARFRDMTARSEALIVTDQTGYLASLGTLNQIARDNTTLANRQSKLKVEKVEQLRKEDDFIGQRNTQLKSILTLLQKIKAEVDEALVKQAQIEAGLFEIQREVAITLDEVYRLEAKLAARERELLKLNPLPNAP